MEDIIKKLAIEISGITNYPKPLIEEVLRKGLGEVVSIVELNDQAEVILEKVSGGFPPGPDSFILTGRIEQTLFALKSARKKAGRELRKSLSF